MFRKSFLTALSFGFVVYSSAQSVISIINDCEIIPSLAKTGDNGFRSIKLNVLVSLPSKKPNSLKKTTFKIRLSNLSGYSNPPVLLDTVSSIYEFVSPLKVPDSALALGYKYDSTKWLAVAVCNIKLQGFSPDEESYYLFKEGDPSSSHIILIEPPLHASVSAQPISATGTITTKNDTPNNTVLTGRAATVTQTQTISNQATAGTTSTANASAISPVETARVLAQSSSGSCNFHIIDSVINLSPIYEKNHTEIDTIRVRITRDDSPPSKNKTEKISFATKGALFPFPVKFTDSVIQVKGDQWVRKDDQWYADIYLLFSNTALEDTLKKNSEVTELYITCDNKHSRYIYLVAKPAPVTEYTPDIPFWAEVGTNFDLVDKVQTQNIYSGIFMFEKDIASFHLNAFRGDSSRLAHKRAFKNNNNVSFVGGVYETKSISLATSSDSGIVYKDSRSFIPDTSGMYPYFRDTGSVKSTSSVTSIGIFIAPHFRLNKLPTDQNGFHWYLSLYAEMLWQRVHTSYDYSNLHPALTNRTLQPDTIPLNFKESEYNQDYRSHYFGIGLPFYIRDYDPAGRWKFSLYVNTVLGASTQKFIAVQNPAATNRFYKPNSNPLTNAFAYPTHNWNAFYLFQFRLNEEKAGISFTGDVRGFLLPDSKPVISLSLSKKINIVNLYNSIANASGSK